MASSKKNYGSMGTESERQSLLGSPVGEELTESEEQAVVDRTLCGNITAVSLVTSAFKSAFNFFTDPLAGLRVEETKESKNVSASSIAREGRRKDGKNIGVVVSEPSARNFSETLKEFSETASQIALGHKGGLRKDVFFGVFFTPDDDASRATTTTQQANEIPLRRQDGSSTPLDRSDATTERKLNP